MTQPKKKEYINVQENFKLTPKLKATLQKASENTGESKSKIIRMALEMWFNRFCAGWKQGK